MSGPDCYGSSLTKAVHVGGHSWFLEDHQLILEHAVPVDVDIAIFHVCNVDGLGQG